MIALSIVAHILEINLIGQLLIERLISTIEREVFTI